MIKFFRRIRQKLLDEGNLKRYLIYAIGEILLVMVGILLALQVNNWNEVSKNRINEQFILNNLYQDFQYNQEEIQEKIRATKLSDAAIKSIIQLFKNKNDENLEDDQRDSLINFLFIRTTFDPKMTTMNELVKNGKLNIIQNQKLRDIINGWERNSMEVKEIETRMHEVGAMLINYLQDKYPMADVYSKNGTWRKIEYNSSFETDKKEIFHDMQFENIISTKSHWNKYLIRRYEAIEEDIQKILNLSQREI